jgi:biuret amidohydrolase
MITVAARPYDYRFPPGRTALVVIDMQRDFIEHGGFGAALGNDVSRLASIIPTVKNLLSLFRSKSWPIIHTREAHRPDLTDCPPSKIARGSAHMRIGEKGAMGRLLIAGEPGNDIIPEVAPCGSETIVNKPGKGMFWATGLHELLLRKTISHLVFAGVTTEVCVQTSMREANDRGYECLLITDATDSYFPEFKAATIEMITAQGGIVGWATPFAKLQAAVAT